MTAIASNTRHSQRSTDWLPKQTAFSNFRQAFSASYPWPVTS